MNMVYFERLMCEAKEKKAKYICVFIEMGLKREEMIINSIDNVDEKLAYYMNTYDINMKHEHAKGIEIVGVMHGDNLNDFQRAFELKQRINNKNKGD